ncbi:MAG: hypothetical protein ABIH83_00605 [Candidatus Micrarchaeota archaeon]
MFGIKKEDQLKFGVYALIAIFVFSTMAVYVGGGSSQPDQPSGGDLATFTGYAQGNATVVSYDPSLEIEGEHQNLSQLIKELKEQKIVLHDIKTANGRILMLGNSNNITRISKRIEELGLTSYADAIVFVDPIVVVGDASSITLEGQNFRQKMVPIFEIGEQFPVQFNAQIVNSELYSHSDLIIVPGEELYAELKPEKTTLLSTSLLILIPWEERKIDYSEFEASLPEGAELNYTSKSFVSFNPPLPQDVLQQVSVISSDYSTSMQAGIMSLNPSFTDKGRIISDLSQFQVIPIFPPSVMEIYSSSENVSLDSEKIKKEFSSAFPEMDANFTSTYYLNITLPSEFSVASKTYTLVQREIQISSLTPPSESGRVQIIFTPIGSRVFQYRVEGYSGEESENIIEVDEFLDTGDETTGEAELPDEGNETTSEADEMPEEGELPGVVEEAEELQSFVDYGNTSFLPEEENSTN